MYYIGIDLGTSAVKMILVDEEGRILHATVREYPIQMPFPGWSQQRPEDWREAVIAGISELVKNVDRSKVAGIGVSGQMHGLVALDEADRVIRPAIFGMMGALRRRPNGSIIRLGRRDCRA